MGESYDSGPSVEIHQDGRRWYGHRTMGLFRVEGLIIGKSREAVERKALKWIADTIAAREQDQRTRYTLTSDDLDP